MTFDEIVTEVGARLNLTSPEAIARIGREVNDRNRRVTSSIGLITARRVTVSANTVIGDSSLTFANCEKILSVYDLTSGKRRVLQERTFDELRNSNTAFQTSGDPWVYAVSQMLGSSVTILLDPVPTSVITLYADAYGPAATLAGTDVPPFASDFHDILMHGAVADELRKKDDKAGALDAERQYEGRLSDLRLFIAKSAYLDIVQGRGRSYRFPVSRWFRW